MMTSRDRIFAFLDGRAVGRVPLMPITMMFAARQIGVPYREYVTDYHALAEAQIQTAARFGFDHVSAISDPTRESADLGAPIQFFENQPPSIVEERALLADRSRLERLEVPDPLGGGRMTDRVRGIAELKRRVGGGKIVEGWIEGPVDAASNLRGINTLMLDFTDNPEFVHALMQFVVRMELTFARAQVEAGADIIGMGDPASSIIGPRRYEEFSWPYQKMIVEGVHALGARIRVHICGNTRRSLTLLGRLGADILDVDSAVPIAEARERTGLGQALLGGIDPVRTLSLGSPDLVVERIAECRRQAGPRYIIGAGCEVPPETPPANLEALSGCARL